MSFPWPKEPTLSVIDEEPEHSASPHLSYEPVALPETSRYSDNYNVAGAAHAARASIFSSETSYGELLAPGQSMFKNLGLGISYDKSLPSLPPGSATAASASARSGYRTESVGGSVVHSDVSRQSVNKSVSSRHSLAKSQSSRHSVDKPVETSPGFMDKAEFLDVPNPPRYSATKSASSGRSSVKSESSIHYEHSEPVIANLPSSPPPSPPAKKSQAGAISTLSTQSSSHSSAHTDSGTSSPKSTSASSASTRSTIRTFDDVVNEVATSLAVRAKMHALTMPTSDRTMIGVCAPMSRGDNQSFLRILAAKVHQSMSLQSSYLFALVPSGPSPASTLVFCGAPQRLVTRASIMAGLRFKTRLAELQDNTGTWIGQLEPVEELDAWDAPPLQERILWDIVRKAANPADPAEPPPGSRGIERILADARARLDRLSPSEAFAEAMQDGILVDIRPAAQRAEHGSIPGALMIERNVLEWRFDPRSVDGRLPIADRYDLRIIVYCQEGYTSSLAAASLQDIGLWQATDIDGGFSRWKSEGFPVNSQYVPADARSVTGEHQSVTPAASRHGAVMGEGVSW